MNYTYDNLLTIAEGQLALENEYVEKVRKTESQKDRKIVSGRSSHSPLTTHHPLLFIDTDMYVMKVWCEFAFEKCHRFILDQVIERKYDLYLLCNTDLPWTNDKLREYPDIESRNRLFHIYKDNLMNQSVPWVEISGDYEQRLQKAITAVDVMVRVDTHHG